MRISIKTKKRNLLITTGSDANNVEAVEWEWVQMQAGDFTPAPETEPDEYEEEEEVPSEMMKVPSFTSAVARNSIGFRSTKPTVL